MKRPPRLASFIDKVFDSLKNNVSSNACDCPGQSTRTCPNAADKSSANGSNDRACNRASDKPSRSNFCSCDQLNFVEIQLTHYKHSILLA